MTPSKQKKLLETTTLVEHIDCDVIKSTARRTFTVGSVTVAVGQTFLLVRSSSDPTRYYVVIWSDRDYAYKCSCGCPAHRPHTHTQAAQAWIVAHRVTPVSAPTGATGSTKQLPRATDVATKSRASGQPHDSTVIRGTLSSNNAFNLYR